MRRICCLNALLWVPIVVSLLFNISFVSRHLNAALFFSASVALTVLVVSGLGKLTRAARWPRWLGIFIGALGGGVAMSIGIVLVFVALLDGSVPFDSMPERISMPNGMVCRAQTHGGATVSVERAEVVLLQQILPGLEREIDRRIWVLDRAEPVPLETECVKLLTNSSL